MKTIPPRTGSSRSWDAVADWYTGWAGGQGSRHHRQLAIPLALELLDLAPDELLADLGCGPGVMAPHAARLGARLLGVDLSPKMIAAARRQHGATARFEVGDVTRLRASRWFRPAAFDAALFLLSLQDIDPLEHAIASAAGLLRPGGRLVVVMLHPCFRVPRQSGWGWDDKRALQFRRLDSYLSRLAVPMQPYARGRGTTRSYHRPLGDYVAAMEEAGLAITGMREVAGLEQPGSSRAARRAAAEFPLLLGIRAIRSG